jgi:cytochrome b6-f complex iron-sulfur subunit
MQRKEFIKTCSGLCLVGLGRAAVLSSCGSANYYAKHTEQENKIEVLKKEFLIQKKGNAKQREYVLVTSDQLQTPICLYKHSDEDYTALLMLCTHQGCELTVAGQMLNCPCHGSDFDSRGIVQNPPADKNLTSFKVSTDAEKIYIHIH